MSDGGTEFRGETTEVLTDLSIPTSRVPAGRSTSNSGVERTIRDLVDILASVLRDTKTPLADWHLALPSATRAYNVKPRKADGLSPYQRLFGAPPPVPALLQLNTLEFGVDSIALQAYPEGTKVWWKRHNDKKTRANRSKTKLHPSWSAAVVVKVVSPHIRRIQLLSGTAAQRRPRNEHIFDLKPYISEELEDVVKTSTAGPEPTQHAPSDQTSALPTSASDPHAATPPAESTTPPSAPESTPSPPLPPTSDPTHPLSSFEPPE